MCTSKFKRSLSIFLSLLIIITSLPVAVISSAADDLPVIMEFTFASSADFHRYYKQVYSVTFLDKIDTAAMSGALESWDISADQGSGEVMSWMYLNADATASAGENRYDVYIAGNGGVAANPKSGYIFAYFENLAYINGTENFNTSNATSFKALCYRCYELKFADFSSWDTSSVTDLSQLFDMTTANNSPIIPALEYVNLSGWDTSKVTTMSYMFNNCKSLLEVDISSFDTHNVTNMERMFYLCLALEKLYIGDEWTVENVTNDNAMFNCCYVLAGGKEQYDNEFKFVTPGKEVAHTGDKGFLTHISEKPQPEKKEYKVTYEFIGSVIPEGASVPVESVFEEGTKVSVADLPYADGYRFSGWSTVDADITSGSFVINNDVHIVGSWEKLYKVTYKYADGYAVPDGAPELPSFDAAAGEILTVNSIPFVDRYVFVGWTTSDVTVNENVFEMPEKDVTLYGYFKIPVESVEINGGDIIVNMGEEPPVINVTVRPDDATIKDIIYESDNENVVKVDEKGKITAIGEGTATITVYSKDDHTKSDTITITVKNPVTDIETDRNIITLNKSDTDKINVSVKPDNATNKLLDFSSDNEDVVTVDNLGNIVAVGEGTATITVKSKDNPAITETVVITVKIPVTEITAADDFTVNLGDTKNVEAKTNNDATNKELIYESSNPDVVKVDSEGNIVAVGEGSSTITITSKDNPEITETVTVTVKIPAEDIIIEKTDYKLNIGETENISAVIKPDNTTNKGLTYESNNKNIVIVDSDGKITAVGEGTTTITITSEDNPSVTRDVTVTVTIPVDDVIIAEDNLELEIGDTETLTTIITPENATNKDVSYKSSDESIVIVDENGKITAIGEGVAKITVTLNDDSSKTDVVTVSVKKPHVNVDKVEADRSEIEIEIGETDKITATITPDNATVKDVVFESDDESIVIVDENGNITAVGEGTATIIVKSKDDNSKYDLITVTVKKPYIPDETTTEVEETTTEAEETITDVEETTTEAEETTTEAEETTTEAEETTTEAEETTTEAEETTTETEESTTDVEETTTEAEETTTEVEETTTEAEETTTDVEETTTEAEETTTEAEETTTEAEETTTEAEETTTETEEPTTEPEEPTEPEKTDVVVEIPDKLVLTAGIPTSSGIKITPENADIKFVLTSENENIAFVDENGMIVGILPGSTNITVEFENGEIRTISVIVIAPVNIPQIFHICFGKTDGIGWYEVSVNGGDFFPQGPNSTLEVRKGDVLIIRTQDLWIDDDFEFYVNGFKVPETAPNQITVVVDGFMLIGALSMDISVPDIEESLNLFEKIIRAIKAFFEMIESWFKK